MNQSQRYLEAGNRMEGTDGGFAGQGNSMTQQSVLNAFDFSAIEEMDPSLGK